MSEDPRLRSHVNEALGAEQPDPALRARVIDSMPVDPSEPRSRLQWAMGAIAIVLAIAIVGSFTYFRAGGRQAASGQPAGSLNMAAQLDFSCTLPFNAFNSAATVSIPDGRVTISSVAPTVDGKGGGFGTTYVGGRWLPVQPAWLSPDRRSYGYATQTMGVPGQPVNSAVYLHEIASGKDRQLWVGPGGANMLGFAAGGVYFMRQSMGAPNAGYALPELWVVDPANPAAAHRVGPNPPPAPPQPGELGGYGFLGPGMIAGTGSWSATHSQPQLQPPAPGVPYFPKGPDQVQRMDLKDGTVALWYTAPEGKLVNIIGFDSQGHPVMSLMSQPNKPVNIGPGSGGTPPTPDFSMMYPPPPTVLLLTGANQTAIISDGTNPGFRPVTVSGDSHGMWFGVPGSLWLYAKGSLKKVADVPDTLFPVPTAPPGAQGKPGYFSPPPPPPGYPTGPPIRVAGACA